ncbi:hypothetical protein P4S60_13850 [Pseudoalteromonas sp. Hal040]|uniref:hypothetical protein n=1 Tax=unclassified Pseudoalteromonas TaxID=194690 RepID=UPI00301E04B4
MKNVFFAVLTLCTLFITYKVVNLLESNSTHNVMAVETAKETAPLILSHQRFKQK